MNSISAALRDLRTALEGLVSDHHHLRRQLDGLAQRGTFQARAPGRRGAASNGGGAKRGRAFKFTDAQAAEFRAQVEGGKSAAGLAKELKVSLPTMYSTLRRAGWSARRGRPAGSAARSGRASSGSRKRGRAFKFTDAQAAELRKQVDGGKSALALAKELKISLPTMYSTLKRAGWTGRGGKSGRSTPAAARRSGAPAKRGRPFKFTDDQAAGFRRRVESGETASAVAKELKISLPAMYNTLKRVGWKGRKAAGSAR